MKVKKKKKMVMMDDGSRAAMHATAYENRIYESFQAMQHSDTQSSSQAT